MRLFHGFLVLGVIVLAGCQQQPGPTDRHEEQTAAKEGKFQAAFAELDPEDRKLAEAQKRCPITEKPLGSMGKPYKLMLEDQPVFLCCKPCDRQALANPEQTLAKVRELVSSP